MQFGKRYLMFKSLLTPKNSKLRGLCLTHLCISGIYYSTVYDWHRINICWKNKSTQANKKANSKFWNFYILSVQMVSKGGGIFFSMKIIFFSFWVSKFCFPTPALQITMLLTTFYFVTLNPSPLYPSSWATELPSTTPILI